MLVGYFVDFTSPYIFKSIFTLLNNKQEVHLKSILKCRDLGKSNYIHIYVLLSKKGNSIGKSLFISERVISEFV